jgi:hypothetical protein
MKSGLHLIAYIQAMYRILIFALTIAGFMSCKESPGSVSKVSLDQIAQQYIRIALVTGQYDEAFVDAYYGPDSLKPATEPGAVFPKDSLIRAVSALRQQLLPITVQREDTLLQHRAGWIRDQLVAFERRIRIYSGEHGSFDAESNDLFGVSAPEYKEDYFQSQLALLDEMLPGEGSVYDRFQTLANRFIIPGDKLDTVFKTAIADCRKKTLVYYSLPDHEDFQLEFVTDKSWNGYNWYKGNYQSLIQINTDLDIFIDRAIDVGSHESYPGHHVYNMLLEKNLYADRGFVEMSVYPLYSPQSLIAEGSANYGIEMVFPGKEKAKYAGYILLPLAGLDTTGIDLYFRALEIKGRLNYVRNEVGRRLVRDEMTDIEAMRWLQEYGLYNEATAAKSLAFIRTYRSYVINYNYGLDLVKAWVEKQMGTDTSETNKWKVFEELLSNQVRIVELL